MKVQDQTFWWRPLRFLVGWRRRHRTPWRSAIDYGEVREVVQRAQDDLGHVRGQGARNDKERERLDNARKHLSDFDRNLSKNKFDKGRLDSAIDDVKNVLENNTLEARDRDALTTDLADLRRIRTMRGE
jgi:hypothetical protein